MLSVIKELFFPKKDYMGRPIDEVIERLSRQTDTPREVWSYLEQEHLYENTVDQRKVYPHELVKF